ncbi:hypothetical protein [Dyadobacter sp. CY312]|uniref:hypothetical protein n=1 Tax=Dyadobacter sp. CY312 TaxID=2907303 RepID=UPI001F2BF028|nr:hypothetical protein [Dyadobacter sp. CY312]MCE7043293.1 hypothetical protein [Dyadobacter sp. CY312]
MKSKMRFAYRLPILIFAAFLVIPPGYGQKKTVAKKVAPVSDRQFWLAEMDKNVQAGYVCPGA